MLIMVNVSSSVLGWWVGKKNRLVLVLVDLCCAGSEDGAAREGRGSE